MSQRPYRCHNDYCAVKGRNFEFWAEFVRDEKPKCPNCHKDSKVVNLEIIHFDPPSNIFGVGVNYRTCNPAKHVSSGMASGDPYSVNCPKCRETEAWKKVVAINEDEDVGVPMFVIKDGKIQGVHPALANAVVTAE